MVKKKAKKATTRAAAKTPTVEKKRTRTAPPPHTAAYEAALREYADAMRLLHKQDYTQALATFKKLEAANPDEPELAERSRTYATICQRKLDPPTSEPSSTDERFHRAVVLANQRRLDESLQLLDRALQDEPGNASLLYARASARALQGNTDAAVADLRQAIAIDPTIRYQAANDPDFEKIRDDAAFIDVIEPTAAGA